MLRAAAQSHQTSAAQRWDTLLIAIEMFVVVVLGFLPESAPVQISQVAINFIASMQYNTFRQAQGVAVATTFATNHIRQIGIGLAKEVKHLKSKEKEFRKKAWSPEHAAVFCLREPWLGPYFAICWWEKPFGLP